MVQLLLTVSEVLPLSNLTFAGLYISMVTATSTNRRRRCFSLGLQAE